jgi:hypothetical protein
LFVISPETVNLAPEFVMATSPKALFIEFDIIKSLFIFVIFISPLVFEIAPLASIPLFDNISISPSEFSISEFIIS